MRGSAAKREGEQNKSSFFAGKKKTRDRKFFILDISFILSLSSFSVKQFVMRTCASGLGFDLEVECAASAREALGLSKKLLEP